MAHVIGITGPPGSGKTSLARGLVGRLEHARALHFDDYETITSLPVEEILAWAQRGADCNEFVIADLPRELAALRREGPERFVLFETPFGREHKATGEHIDLLVWIDLPLDLALARKLREFIVLYLSQGREVHTAGLAWCRRYLDCYVDGIGHTLQLQRDRIAARADIVVDGRQPTDEMVARAVRGIRERLT